MARFRAFVFAAVGALSFSASAHAADLPDSWSPREPRVTELVSGWYLRGDVGYRFMHVDRVDSGTPMLSQRLDNSFGAGGGIGYKYRFLRADATVDYGIRAKFEGTTATFIEQPQYKAELQPITALANVYLDLGTWYGFTPYVGVGAGATYWRGIDYANTGTGTASAWSQEKAHSWSWSWAWMAGLSYQVSQHWIVDVGYRQLYLGDAISGRDAMGTVLEWHKLSAQEVRVGLRFMIE